MINNSVEYENKYEEYVRLLTILELAKRYADKTYCNCDVSDLENKLNELENELYEYKKKINLT